MKSDQHWVATTEHGTTYTYQGGSIIIDSERHGKYSIYPSLGFKSVDRDQLESATREGGDSGAWEVIRNSPEVDLPEIGKSIYIGNFQEWRLSTDVVSLEILEKD